MKLRHLIAALPLLAWLFKFWPSDRFQLLAALAYIPAPIIVLWAFVMVISFFAQKQIRCALMSMLALVLAAGLVFYENQPWFRSHSKHNGRAGTIRILHWNVWGARKGFDRIMQEILSEDPDVICISEFRHFNTLAELPYLRQLSSNWQQIAYKNILVLSRIPMKKIGDFTLRRFYGAYVAFHDPGIKFTIFFVDVPPQFLFYRSRAFHALRADMEKQGVQPDLMLGDFNTPSLSFSLRSAFADYQDAYRIQGSGVGYTWPAWFPMLRIDLMLARRPESVVHHQIGRSNLSDHCWQYIDWKVEPLRGIDFSRYIQPGNE